MKKEYYFKKCGFIWHRTDMSNNTHLENLRYVLWLIDQQPMKRSRGQFCTNPEKIEKMLTGMFQIIPRKKNFNKILTKLYGHLSRKVRDQKFLQLRLSMTYKTESTPTALEINNKLTNRKHKQKKQAQIFHRQESLSQKTLFGDAI